MRARKMNGSRLAMRAVLAALCAGILMVPESAAEGNLTRRAVRLEALKIDAAKGFSKKSYQLETGKYYRWRVVSDGRGE